MFGNHFIKGQLVVRGKFSQHSLNRTQHTDNQLQHGIQQARGGCHSNCRVSGRRIPIECHIDGCSELSAVRVPYGKISAPKKAAGYTAPWINMVLMRMG